MVWEYVNPIRNEESEAYIPWLVSGERFAPNDLPFVGLAGQNQSARGPGESERGIRD